MFTGAGKQLITSSITVAFPSNDYYNNIATKWILLPEQYFYRVLNTHRAEARKLAWKMEMEFE